MAIYLEFEGIKGNVTANGYENHIAVDSCLSAAGAMFPWRPGT